MVAPHRGPAACCLLPSRPRRISQLARPRGRLLAACPLPAPSPPGLTLRGMTEQRRPPAHVSHTHARGRGRAHFAHVAPSHASSHAHSAAQSHTRTRNPRTRPALRAATGCGKPATPAAPLGGRATQEPARPSKTVNQSLRCSSSIHLEARTQCSQLTASLTAIVKKLTKKKHIRGEQKQRHPLVVAFYPNAAPGSRHACRGGLT